MAEISVIVRDVRTYGGPNNTTVVTYDATGSGGMETSGATCVLQHSSLGDPDGINAAIIADARAELEADPSDRVTLFGGCVAQG